MRRLGPIFVLPIRSLSYLFAVGLFLTAVSLAGCADYDQYSNFFAADLSSQSFPDDLPDSGNVEGNEADGGEQDAQATTDANTGGGSTAVDADGDGAFTPADCNDNDNTIFPGAVDGCDGVDTDCDTVVDEDCPEDCTGMTVTALGRSYAFCTAQVLYVTAKNRCEEMGMVMLKIGSELEQNTIQSITQQLGWANLGYDLWLGTNDGISEGTWTWDADNTTWWIGDQTGGPFNGAYSNWVAGQPNGQTTENCARFRLQVAGNDLEAVGQWRDIPCDETVCVGCLDGGHAFVCQQMP